MRYTVCELDILDEKNTRYKDNVGRHANGEIQLDELTKVTVERLNRWVAKYDKCCERGDLMALGLHLYNILFDPELRECQEELVSVRKQFEATFGVFVKESEKDGNVRLRLILRFHQGVKELASYPWEFMFMPFKPKGFFLAGEKTELILTRFVPESELVKRLTPEEKPLRILIVYSHPRELDIIDPDVVIRRIQSLEKEGHIKVEYLENPHYDQLKNKIYSESKPAESFEPHILHFIGHGKPGHIALVKTKKEILEEVAEKDKDEEEIHQAKWIESESISELFADHQPRLVFLESCSSAAAVESVAGLKSIARDLVYKKIPAVVAMQYEIYNDDASVFAETVYQQLSMGRPLDEAVTKGRRKLGQKNPVWSTRSFGTPVLYLQTEAAIIAESSESDTGSSPPSTLDEDLSLRKVACPYPGCPGKIALDDVICLTCKREVSKCPAPECQGMIPTAIGICPKCKYGLESAAARIEVGVGTIEEPGEYLSFSKPGLQPEVRNILNPGQRRIWSVPGMAVGDKIAAARDERILSKLQHQAAGINRPEEPKG